MGFRWILPFGAAVVLATWSWGQTAPTAVESSQSADRAVVDRSATLPMHSSNSWKFSPLEDQPYAPLDLKSKFYAFGYRSIEPTGLGKSLVSAAIAQWQDSPKEWGQGMEGYAKRYGHRLGIRASEDAIGFGVAAALHQDPRYFRLENGSFARRTVHALSYTLITRNDHGDKTFSGWRVAGCYGAQFVSNSWRPADTTAGDALVRGTVSLGYVAVSNLAKEFWPDIRRNVFKK